MKFRIFHYGLLNLKEQLAGQIIHCKLAICRSVHLIYCNLFIPPVKTVFTDTITDSNIHIIISVCRDSNILCVKDYSQCNQLQRQGTIAMYFLMYNTTLQLIRICFCKGKMLNRYGQPAVIDKS